MLRHPDFLYAFDVRGLYFHANLITEISTKVKSKKLPGNYSRQSCVFYSAIHCVLDGIPQILHLAHSQAAAIGRPTGLTRKAITNRMMPFCGE